MAPIPNHVGTAARCPPVCTPPALPLPAPHCQAINSPSRHHVIVLPCHGILQGSVASRCVTVLAPRAAALATTPVTPRPRPPTPTPLLALFSLALAHCSPHNHWPSSRPWVGAGRWGDLVFSPPLPRRPCVVQSATALSAHIARLRCCTRPGALVKGLLCCCNRCLSRIVLTVLQALDSLCRKNGVAAHTRLMDFSGHGDSWRREAGTDTSSWWGGLVWCM